MIGPNIYGALSNGKSWDSDRHTNRSFFSSKPLNIDLRVMDREKFGDRGYDIEKKYSLVPKVEEDILYDTHSTAYLQAKLLITVLFRTEGNQYTTLHK